MRFSFGHFDAGRLSGLTLLVLGALTIWSADVLERPAKHIHVRWRTGVDAIERVPLERRFSLVQQEVLGGQTFGYDLLDESTPNVRALVQHPAAQDTQDLDRQRFTVAPTAGDGKSRIGPAERWGVASLVPFVMPLGILLVAVGAVLMSLQPLTRALQWAHASLEAWALRRTATRRRQGDGRSVRGTTLRADGVHGGEDLDRIRGAILALAALLPALQSRLTRVRALLRKDIRTIELVVGRFMSPPPAVMALVAAAAAPILAVRSALQLLAVPRPSPAALAVLASVAIRMLAGWNSTTGTDVWFPWLEMRPWPVHHLVSAVLLATSAWLTFRLAARHSGDPAMALVIVLALIWIFPLSASGVGLLLYAMVVWACARYIDGPGREGVWLLTLLTVAVGACRVDHGLYVAVAAVAALAVRHLRDGARAFGRTTLEYAGTLAVVTLLFLPLGRAPALLNRIGGGIADVVAARGPVPATSAIERRSAISGQLAGIVGQTSGARSVVQREDPIALPARTSALAGGLRWMWVILPVAAAIGLGYQATRRTTRRPDTSRALIVLPALLPCLAIGWRVGLSAADAGPASPALPALAVVAAWLFTGLVRIESGSAGTRTQSWVDAPLARAVTPYRARDMSIGIGLVLLTVFLHLHGNDDVTNDHAAYLSMARQIVYGDWPIRDFRDDGSLLQILLSAAVQKAGGFHLLGEMLLSWTFFAAGSCLTFWLAFRLSGSRAAAVVAAVLAALLIPRPYAYPKLFIYPLATLVLFRYVDRPQVGRLAAVAATTALAFLFRIDHGVVIAATSAVVIAAVHAAQPRAVVARELLLSASVVLFALPQMAYITWSAGVPRYVESILTFGSYADATREPLPFAPWLGNGLFTEANAVTFLFDLSVMIVGAALVYVMARGARAWRERREVPRESLHVLAVAVMWVLMIPMLARGQYYTRIAEIGQAVAILGAWLWVVSAGPGPRRIPRVAAGAVVLVLTAGALSLRQPLVALLGDPGGMLAAPFRTQLLNVWATSAPIDNFAPADVNGERWMVRYAQVCTKPTDRLLVTWFAPETYFFAGRAFAGDRWVYLPFDNSPERQRFVAERIRAQSVPIVFVDMAQYARFRDDWPAIAGYLDDEYVVAADVTLNSDRVTRVLTRRGLNPSRHLSFANLPCFA